MGWVITEPESGLSAPLVTVAGDIEIEEVYETAVHRSLRGANPQVTEGARQPATIRLPEVLCRSAAEVDALRIIRDLSRRCILTDPLGREWPVKFVGSFLQRIAETPDQANAPVVFVTVAVVGVA